MGKRVVTEAKRQRRRPTRQGQVLSEQLFVDTALRLLAQEDGQGLSVRRLAAALGTDPSTLYRYFRGMDDLTLAIGDELMRRAVAGWRATGRWRSDLRELGLRVHASYLAHPQAAVLTASRVSGRIHEVAADEVILGILRTAGFGDRDAVRIYHAFVDQSLAFAVLDAASLALPRTAREADEAMWQTTYARLPAATHPHIAATSRHLIAHMNTSAYPSALDMLLDSAQAQLADVQGAVGDQ
ncbi:TetR/AcrR family transcriptional regulator [Streptomyces sp. PTM05]|uniref:TetR/AcrR family transcriptional regulator n=1 Tax=Streptantibioticus parmotrematis TaxID=2873249 RepID=A0ABS7QPT5_9ACTN|nr:TetR/AcrR family transcriptional regulator [Streptantibioticus parmotrematis]MBY8885200.1 TetR/AcrR family transcriptional regulator [Streptantibioticus parmotrematis]